MGDLETTGDRKRILERLEDWSVVTAGQLEQAGRMAKERSLPLEQALHNLRFTGSPDPYTVVSEHFGIPYVDLAHFSPDPDAVSLLPEAEARRLQVLPLFRIGNQLMVAVADPLEVEAADRVRDLTGLEVVRSLADASRLARAIDRLYGAPEKPEEIIRDLSDEFEIPLSILERLEAGQEEAFAAPIAEFLQKLIRAAVRERASDIHVNPERDGVTVKFRIDGILRPHLRVPKKILYPLVSHVKVKSNLDISISMRPQDGEFHVSRPEGDLDVRVSILPTIHGENLVMRILNASSMLMDLSALGFSPPVFAAVEKLIARPHGIFLITGPTGSGKTTTLYSVLSRMDSEKLNIITVEDPAEYKLAGIRQVQVNRRAGLTFATALRSIVRQDPDIIMIGEIRDLETAEIAVQAALTGHLVLGTLHTNNAPSGVTRLVEMGVPAFLVASSVIGILAQRLIRLICPACREPSPRETRLLRELLGRTGGGEPAGKSAAFRGKGCGRCGDSGYRGRTTIAELMVMDDRLRELVGKDTPTAELIAAARSGGMGSLLEDGLAKAAAGQTSLEEVSRVVEIEDALPAD